MEILKNTEENQKSVRKRLIYIISLILCITAILICSFILIFSNNRNAEAAPWVPGIVTTYTYVRTNMQNAGYITIESYITDTQTFTNFPELLGLTNSSGNPDMYFTIVAYPYKGYKFEKFTYSTQSTSVNDIPSYAETQTSTSNTLYRLSYLPANITVYWAVGEVTINFDQQSGTGGVGSVTASPDEAMPTLTSLPSRTGYTFGGYYTSPNGGGTQYYNANGVSTHNCDLSEGTTLYAKWTANTYTVVYNSNKPSNASSAISGTMSNVTHTYDTAKNLTANAYSLTGWTFKGWAISSGGSVVYNDKASVKNLATSGTYNLYAVWQPNTYTITYNSNKPSNASTSISGTTANSVHTYDISKALTKNGYFLPGYTFLGWATSASGDVVLDDSATIRNLTETNGAVFNLYAKWTANTYYIKYNANGATGGTMANSVHTFDTSKALSDNKFTWANHRFLGWATSSTATTPAYQNGQAIINLTTTAGNTVNLYAVWELFWTVTADSNIGEGGAVLILQNGNIAVSNEFDPGSQITLYAIPNINYGFVGWEASGVALNQFEMMANPLTITVNNNINLTALFSDSMVDGVYVSATQGGMVYLVGDDFASLGDEDYVTVFTKPSMTGYAFSHWEDASGNILGTDTNLRIQKAQIINSVLIAVYVSTDDITSNDSTNMDTNN